MKIVFPRLIILLMITVVLSCNERRNKEEKIKKSNTSESLIKTNRYLVNTENQEIENYIRRHKLDMVETGSGLRYLVYHHGNGNKIVKGQWVELNYSLSLITGDIVYNSDESGPMSFKTGRGGVESGLEEAILLLRNGDKAKVIIPSHLAHGLMGDDNKIPARSTVIYDLEIINVK